jgi:peptidoglycan hydrolase-like protein with peptidoglycan-binding domain
MELRKVLATAGALALIAGIAFAQDIQSLINQILSYLQQNPQVVQQVQQAVGQTAGVPSACQGVTFTRTLKLGMRGADVKCLQALLNVTPQTGYFGPLTRAAVIKFQEDHADEILAPLGLSKGTGVVGPSTRAVLNKMISGAPQAQIPTPEQAKSIWDLFVEALKKELGIAPTPAPTAAGEEGTLTAEGMAVPTGVTVYEGDKNVAVMAFKVKAKGSAITIDRVDLAFDAGGAVVYKYINYVALYDGDNAIKGTDLNSSTMEKSGSTYTVRLSGLGVKVEKDSEKVLTVKVSAATIYPSGGPSSITVKINKDGIRGTDSAGIQQYAPNEEISKDFNLAPAETGKVEASLNANSPKEGIQIVSEDEDTEITLAIFDLKAKKQNVTIDEVKINATTSTSTSVIALRLYDGSTLLGEKTPSFSTSTPATTTVAFGNLKINIAKDTTKALTVKALIKKGTDNATYTVALASVSGTDANDNTANATGTPVFGYTQYVYTAAPELALASKSESASGTSATFKITFKATARGGDVWISKSGNDLDVEIVNNTGATSSADSITILPSGIAEENTNAYKIAKDSTATFEVTIVKTGLVSGKQYFARITTVKFNTNGSNVFNKLSGNLVKDLKTGYVVIY